MNLRPRSHSLVWYAAAIFGIFANLAQSDAQAAVLPLMASSEKRLFTVADAIEMTVVTAGARAHELGNFTISPDRRWLVFVTRKGNLQTGYNEFVLLRYRIEDVEKFVNDDKIRNLPHPTILARFEMRGPSALGSDEAIDQVIWRPDSRSLLFIGRGQLSRPSLPSFNGGLTPPRATQQQRGRRRTFCTIARRHALDVLRACFFRHQRSYQSWLCCRRHEPHRCAVRYRTKDRRPGALFRARSEVSRNTRARRPSTC